MLLCTAKERILLAVENRSRCEGVIHEERNFRSRRADRPIHMKMGEGRENRIGAVADSKRGLLNPFSRIVTAQHKKPNPERTISKKKHTQAKKA